MSELSQLAIVWLKKSGGGNGLRLTSDQLDLLNEIGVGELVASAAARAVSKQGQSKRSLSTREDDPSSFRTDGATAPSAHRSTKSYGTTNRPDEIAAARRARLRVTRPE